MHLHVYVSVFVYVRVDLYVTDPAICSVDHGL